MVMVTRNYEQLNILLKELGLPTDRVKEVVIHIPANDVVYADVTIVPDINFEGKQLHGIVERYEFVKKKADGKD